MVSPLANRSFLALTASQLLGAFNDNVYRQIILLFAMGISFSVPLFDFPIEGRSLAMGVFAIPFILFSLLSGSLADRFSKRSIIVAMNVAEICAMALGMLAFALHLWSPDAAIILSMVVLFIMGTQSAIFGPSKYGIIPELVPAKKLTAANAAINMTTQIAIVGGVLVAGELFDFLSSNNFPFYYSGFFFISIATLGWMFSLGIKKTAAANPQEPLKKNVIMVPKHALVELKWLAKDRELLVAVFASSWFYLVGALTLPIFLDYGPLIGTSADKGGGTLFAAVGLGIATGSPLASLLSRQRIELGLVPLAAIGMGGCFMLAGFTDNFWTAHSLIFCAGVFGGLYIVPLASFTQKRPKQEHRGRVMGILELFNFMFIFLSAVAFQVLVSLGLTPHQMVIGLGLLAIVGSLLLTLGAPIYFQRALLLTVIRPFYRFRIQGAENVPTEGGVLFVANHVSYVDPFILSAASPRLPRFIMHRAFVNTPLVGAATRLARVIPISAEDGPRAMINALKEANSHLKEGEAVCIFAEGQITRTGGLQPFSKGLERIAKNTSCKIVPVYLDRVWGSFFSFHRGPSLKKLPQRIPYRIGVAFGQALDANTPTWKVRRAVQELGAEAMDARQCQGETLATRFIRTARRHPSRLAMVDTSKKELSYRKALISTLVMRKLLEPKLKDQHWVGVLLPSSNGGALTNLCLAMMGKVSVNLNFTAGKEAFNSSIEQTQLKTILTSKRFIGKVDIEPNSKHLYLEDLLKDASKSMKISAVLFSFLPNFLLQMLPGLPKDPNADATVIFSSGSTGEPKGVCLTHHNIMSDVRGMEIVLSPSKKDRLIGVLPFFHSFGYTATLWLPMLNGFGAVYHVSPIDAKTIGELIRDYQGSIMFSTPTFYMSYLRRFKPEEVKTLRMTVSGAERLKDNLREQWAEKFGHELLQGYGCTELSPAVSVNIPNIHLDDIQQIGNRPGTIGHPLPGVACKITSPDSMEELPPGEEGMLWVKGPIVMRGYLDRPDLTEQVLVDGWYKTGDIANIDDYGFVSITGRLSRFSKIGGEMVPHIGVEEAVQEILDAHQSSPSEESEEQCCEAAVTAISCPQKGEKLVVLHTPVDLPIADLRSQLMKSDLPKLWIPRKDCFLEVEILPKLGSGKLDLKQLGVIAEESLSPQ